MPGMYAASAGIDHAAPSQSEHETTGRHEISVEALEQRQQSGSKNDVDDPPRTYCLLKSHGRHELLADQRVPWRNEPHCSNNASVEKNANENGHPDGAKETSAAEVGIRFFRRFAHRLKSG